MDQSEVLQKDKPVTVRVQPFVLFSPGTDAGFCPWKRALAHC